MSLRLQSPMDRETPFRRVLALGELSPELHGLADELFPLPGESHERAPVMEMLALAEALTVERPALLITTQDLSLPGFASLFGYADHARGIAVISTFRLGDGEFLRDRVKNEMAHELGHLHGRLHCTAGDCVMRPVAAAAELDSRPSTLCAGCAAGESRPRRAAKLAAAAAFLFTAVVSGNYLLGRIVPAPPPSPFTCLTHDPRGRATPGIAGAEDIAHINFRGRMLFCLRDRAGHPTVRARSLPLIQRLNDLSQLERLPQFAITASNNEARIEADGTLVAEVKSGDVRNGTAEATAREWAHAINEALRKREP